MENVHGHTGVTCMRGHDLIELRARLREAATICDVCGGEVGQIWSNRFGRWEGKAGRCELCDFVMCHECCGSARDSAVKTRGVTDSAMRAHWIREVQRDGKRLVSAPKSLRDDFDVVCAAVCQNQEALAYASSRLQGILSRRSDAQKREMKAIKERVAEAARAREKQFAEQRARDETRQLAKKNAMQMSCQGGLAGIWTKGIIDRDCKTLTRPSGKTISIQVTGDMIKFDECGKHYTGVLTGGKVEWQNGETWTRVSETARKDNCEHEAKQVLKAVGIEIDKCQITATPKSCKYYPWIHPKKVAGEQVRFDTLQVVLCGDSAATPDVHLNNKFDASDSMLKEWAKLRSIFDESMKKDNIKQCKKLQSVYVDVYSALNYFAYHSAVPLPPISVSWRKKRSNVAVRLVWVGT